MLRLREEAVSRAYACSMSVSDIALTSEEDPSLPTHSEGYQAERVLRSAKTHRG